MLHKTNNKRYLYLDVTKAILIILVVLGHSSCPAAHYIYWFHMPAFFLITGVLIKMYTSVSEVISFSKRQGKKFLSTYIVYFLFIFIISLIVTPEVPDLKKWIIKLLFGGRLFVGEFGVFWFITCLFIAQIIFLLSFGNIQSKSLRWLCFTILYIIAHLQSWYLPHIFVPWNADSAVLAACYIYIGYYIKEMGENLYASLPLSIGLFTFFSLVCITFITINEKGLIEYALDMKYIYYKDLVLDIIIPLSFFLLIFSFSIIISRLKASYQFGKIGVYSLVIMYLHLLIRDIYILAFGDSWIITTVLGVALPIVFGLIMNNWKLTRKLFLSLNK